MKITGIKTYKFSVPTGQNVLDPHTGQLLSSTAKPWLFLKIETNEGITGWGEGSGEWLVPSIEATLHEWSCLLVDQDPLKVVALTEDITNRIPWKGGPVFGTAIAAINMALYDIAGKAWGVPVHTILGGQKRERLRVYCGGTIFRSPEEAVSEVHRAIDQGYAGIKGNPLEDRTWPMDISVVENCTLCVAAIREAIGSEFDILLDAHGSPTPELSVEFAHRVSAYQPLFLEEPVKVGSLEALMEVKQKSPVPIATGEKLFTVRDFLPLINQRACAFLQPDTGHCFGITTMVEIARNAEQAQMLMAPHMAAGPVLYAATLQADAVMNNFLIQETHGFTEFNRCIEHNWIIKDGYINISQDPGLGIKVKEEDISQFNYEPLPYRQYRHLDGSWKGW